MTTLLFFISYLVLKGILYAFYDSISKFLVGENGVATKEMQGFI